ncbi:MAG: transposase family protein [bacterium]
MLEKTIDTTKIWLDVKSVAGLKGVTERAVRLALRNSNKYIFKTEDVRGGKTYKICLSSLEAELQTKFLNEYYQALVLEENETVDLDIQPTKEKIIPESMKRIALARLDLLKLWKEYIKGKTNKCKANEEFLQLYNTGEFYKDIFEVLKTTSIGSLYRWKAKLAGTTDWTRLVPDYQFKGSRECRTSLTQDEIQIFMKILLNQNRFSISKATSLTKHILNKRGIEIHARDITYRRYAEHFKKFNYDKWILAREGMKALKDKVESYLVRDASVLDVGSVLIADGKLLNFQVINPFTGKPCRVHLVGFLDWKSGGLVGFEIMLEEDTQCIASALRNAILNLGRIPDIVYQDNGKAFKANFFTGNKDFEELGFNGIYGKLGIKPVYAAPYNARAKVIERFFLEFQEGFEKLLPSYIGSSIENKPAYMKRNEKLHKEIHNGYVPTIQEAIDLINCWLEYKHSLPCPNVKSRTIAEVLATVKKQNINEQELDDLMMAQEIMTIHRNGIRFLKQDYYDDTLYGIRDKAIIKYSLFDLSFIKVYSLKNEFLCRAERITSTHPMAEHLGDISDIQDYKQKIVKQRKLRNKTLKEVRKLFTMDDFNLIEKHLEPNISAPHQEQILLEAKQIPEIKVIAERPLTRPIFKSKYERYEWHLHHGCHSQEDRKWFEKYKNSDEYTQMYGED